MPALEIRALGPLLVAGDASSSGADLATARRRLGDLLVPYIPATALRGAIRIQFEALLRGTGRPVVDPYPLDAEGSVVPEDDLIAALFGYSGPDDERELVASDPRKGSKEGRLRLGDALPLDPQAAADALRVRPGLEIDDETATAADRKLFFREMAELGTDLVFRAPLELRTPLDLPGVSEEDAIKALRAAIAATDSLGAGKAKGGGAIEIRWLEEGSAKGIKVEGDATRGRRARLLITLLEPARFGDGGPLGNHQGTRTYIPGATVRGAIAWTLLNHGKTTPDSAAFRALFLEPQAARFGDALPVPADREEPLLLPATHREDRKTRSLEDVLVRELARERVDAALAQKGSTLALRSDDGERRLDSVTDCRRAENLVRRTRTRVSIDRETGTAADRRLFSIEQVEPTTDGGAPACFVSWVEGIPAEGLDLLASLAGLPIALGSGRNHGLGSVAMELRFSPEAAPQSAPELVRAFSGAVDREARELAKRAGLRPEELAAGRLLLPLVAQSDYVWTSSEAPHPLAETEVENRSEGEPLRKFLRSALTGGFDQRPDRRGPLKSLLPAIGAGSVFVYELETEALADLEGILAILRRGVGQRTECGCGRFALHSVHGLQGAKV